MNTELADELEKLCCAETEGKFFDCVTDNIATIVAALRAPAQGAMSPVTDEMVNAAAREMWNDRDARMGGAWERRDPREVCVIQTKATARAAITAALSALSSQERNTP